MCGGGIQLQVLYFWVALGCVLYIFVVCVACACGTSALRSVITTSKQKNNWVLLGNITTEQQCLQRQEDQ